MTIAQFLKRLERKTKREKVKWLNNDGYIRTKGGYLCPIEFVGDLANGWFEEAATKLGLNTRQSAAIIKGADAWGKLRPRILKAVGLKDATQK